MKLLKTAIVALAMMLVALCAHGQRVFVIPVETEIDMSAFHHFKQGERKALESGADLLLVRLNTYGARSTLPTQSALPCCAAPCLLPPMSMSMPPRPGP